MYDTIDLKEQLERGNEYRRKARRRHRLMWIMMIGFIVASLLLQYMSKQTVLGQIYEYRNGELVEIAPNIASHIIETAPDGSLWAVNAIVNTLYRYDGTTWQVVTAENLSVSNVQDITFFENQVWVLRLDDVMVYDGNTWQTYEMPLSSGRIKGFEAGQFGVVILDELGNLAILQEGEWLYQNVADFLGFETYQDYSYLSMISDGKSLYLSGNGMAVFDGSNWRTRASYDAYALIIGQDETHIWLTSYTSGSSLIAFDKATGEYASFHENLTGLSYKAWIWEMQSQNGRSVFASDEGFVEFDGETWSSIRALEVIDQRYIRDFTLSETGLRFSIIQQDWQEFTLATAGVGLMQACGGLLPLLVFLPMVFFAYRETKQNQERVALTRKRLPALLPDMPEYLPLYQPGNPKKRDWGWLKSSILVIINFVITLGFIAPINPLLGMFLWLFFFFGSSLILPLLNPKLDKSSRSYLLRNLLSIAIFSFVLGGSLLGIVYLTNPFMPYLTSLNTENPLLIFGVGMMLLVPIVNLINIAYHVIPAKFIMQPFYRGNYEESLKRLELMRRIFPKDAANLFHHGFILLELGRWQEAEALWREVIAEAQNSSPGFIAPCLINLANALQAQGKVDEALRLHEAAVKIHPENAGSYRELAQWYLHYSDNPQRASELTEVMMKFASKPYLNLTAESYMWGANLYTHALALAVAGKREEALAMLAKAEAEIDQKMVAAQGFMRLYAAYVHQKLGDIAKARELYQAAIDLHPSYSFSQSAAKALQELDAAQA